MSITIDNIRDKQWRLSNLYKITDKDGRIVTFKPNEEQKKFIENQHTRNIILKARQLGFTTYKCIEQLDSALFEGKRCAMIAHSLADARRLFREKIKFAYNNLPDVIRRANPAISDSAGELVFTKGGSVSVGTSFRGGTLASLHISEFGKICAKYPQKAEELVTGAFEAVPTNGNLTIESTAEGNSGYFFDYCQQAELLKMSGQALSNLDFKFFFFSWIDKKEYEINGIEVLPETEAYFAEIGLAELPSPKKAWYQQKKRILMDGIFREYPTIPSEAFRQSNEAAYYKDQIQAIYADNRYNLDLAKDRPIITAWDLGVSDETAIWFVTPNDIGGYDVIDYYEASGEGMAHYFGVLKRKGYTYDKHIAPHDIAVRDIMHDGLSRKEIAAKGYDIDGVRYRVLFDVAPRTSVIEGINSVREILPFCRFDKQAQAGLNRLQNYRKDWDASKGAYKDKPLHDSNSNGADAFRYFAISTKKRDRKYTFKTVRY